MEEGNLQQQENRLHTRKILIFTLAYFGILISLIVITLIFDIKLSSGLEFFLRFPTPWLLLLWSVYYIVPFIVAVFFAFRTRLLWRNFFTLTILIFAIHFLYSAAVSVPRFLYAHGYQKDMEQSKKRTLNITLFEHQFKDENHDGLTDKVILKSNFASSLPNGNYILFANLSQNGQGLPGSVIGAYDFSVTDGKYTYSPTFEFNPENFRNFTGNLDVDLELRKDISPSNYGKTLVFLCRWAAFFCPTSMEGYDPVINNDLLIIQEVKRAYAFSLPTGTIQREQATFVKFLKDFGRDTNGNGVFDELAIQMELDSIYEGPIYFSADVDGSSNFFSYTTSIKKGVITVDFVVDGTKLKELGFNGPYKLKNFYFLNNDPYCPYGKCIIKNQPPFTVYLERYTTKSYRVEQFE